MFFVSVGGRCHKAWPLPGVGAFLLGQEFAESPLDLVVSCAFVRWLVRFGISRVRSLVQSVGSWCGWLGHVFVRSFDARGLLEFSLDDQSTLASVFSP